MIIKTKFLCKATSKTCPTFGNMPGKAPVVWTDRFTEGKWYDGEYETWSFDDGYRLNGGWRKYWVINEQGVKSDISRPEMNIMFHHKVDEIRNNKIDEILKYPNKQ